MEEGQVIKILTSNPVTRCDFLNPFDGYGTSGSSRLTDLADHTARSVTAKI